MVEGGQVWANVCQIRPGLADFGRLWLSFGPNVIELWAAFANIGHICPKTVRCWQHVPQHMPTNSRKATIGSIRAGARLPEPSN